jgi:hypothetical protein
MTVTAKGGIRRLEAGLDQPEIPINQAHEQVGALISGLLDEDVAAATSPLPLSVEDSQNPAYRYHGTRASVLTVIHEPATTPRLFFVFNDATTKTITVKVTSGGVGVAVPSGCKRLLTHDGTAVYDFLTIIGAGVYNAAGAARTDLYNTVAALSIFQHLSDSGLWQLGDSAGNSKITIASGANGEINFYRGTGAINFNGGGAASFGGNLSVTGSLSKGSGTFLIDHPLDPDTKDLYHGFVEAPRYDLIYRGRVQLKNGEAKVDIDRASNLTPGTFAAITQNVQFNQPYNEEGFARVMVKKDSLHEGTFTLHCEDPNSSDWVSWSLFAERADRFIKTTENVDARGALVPEQMKPEASVEEREQAVTQVVEADLAAPDVERTESMNWLRGMRGHPRHLEAFGRALPSRKVVIKTIAREKEK